MRPAEVGEAGMPGPSGPEPLRAVLFTGAGFTKNFDGFLAEEMSVLIAQRVRDNQRLWELLHHGKNPAFEKAYQTVMSSSQYGQIDRQTMEDAVLRAYDCLDDAIRRVGQRQAGLGVFLEGVNRFIRRFHPGEDPTARSRRGYFFTLNQDMFIERWCAPGAADAPPASPGLQPLGTIHHQREGPVPPQDRRQLPGPEDMVTIRAKDGQPVARSGRFYYVKLHGSVNWTSSDGRRAIVVGGEKEAQIAREPMLEYYFDMFRAVLSHPQRRLCVIGYGFRDHHVNAVIARAVKRHGLQLHVISPQPAQALRATLRAQNLPNYVWNAVQSWPWYLKDIYPSDQSRTTRAQQIEAALFD